MVSVRKEGGKEVVDKGSSTSDAFRLTYGLFILTSVLYEMEKESSNL